MHELERELCSSEAILFKKGLNDFSSIFDSIKDNTDRYRSLVKCIC